MLHLHSRAEYEDLLACIRKHLLPDGHFVLSVYNPSVEILARAPNTRHPFMPPSFDPETGQEIRTEESTNYDAATQTSGTTIYYRVDVGLSNAQMGSFQFFRGATYLAGATVARVLQTALGTERYTSAVNLIVQASRLQDGSRRMTSITEITGMEGDVISMQEVFRFRRVGLTPDNKIIGHFTATGVRSDFSERFRLWGYDLPASVFDPVAAE